MLARLAQDLAGRGRVLPVLADEEDGYAARWHAVLTAADAQRASELAAAMPPVCRAISAAGDPPAQVLTEVLDALADAAVRATLAQTALVPPRGRSSARQVVAQRWLAALTAADARVEVSTEQDEADAALLAARLADWHSAAQAPAGPVRTCFRLVEPELAEPEPAEPELAEDGLAGPELAEAGPGPELAAAGP